MDDKDKKWWSSCTGAIELQMTLDQAESVSHSGDCENDVKILLQDPEIKEQIDKIEPDTLKRVLDEYGAWSDEDLENHNLNVQRLLWLAGGDIADEN